MDQNITRWLPRCFVLVALACASGRLLADSAAAPPNIVFFFADDQAYDTIGCYGNPDVKTPNMDALARRGVVFDRHYDTTAICSAAGKGIAD